MCIFDQLEVLCEACMLVSVIALIYLGSTLMSAMRTFRGEERLLGVRVQFHFDNGGWYWIVPHQDVTIGQDIRFGSRLAARLSVMSCLFAFAVQEECSAVAIPPDPTAALEGDDRPPSVGG